MLGDHRKQGAVVFHYLLRHDVRAILATILVCEFISTTSPKKCPRMRERVNIGIVYIGIVVCNKHATTLYIHTNYHKPKLASAGGRDIFAEVVETYSHTLGWSHASIKW